RINEIVTVLEQEPLYPVGTGETSAENRVPPALAGPVGNLDEKRRLAALGRLAVSEAPRAFANRSQVALPIQNAGICKVGFLGSVGKPSRRQAYEAPGQTGGSGPGGPCDPCPRLAERGPRPGCPADFVVPEGRGRCCRHAGPPGPDCRRTAVADQ